MNKKLSTAATFGGALAVMGLAPELQADIVELNVNPASVAFDTIGSVSVLVALSTANGVVASFEQWNDAIGKSQNQWFGATAGTVSVSQTISSNQTFGGNVGGVDGTFSQTGTSYVGFTDAAGNHGWFSINWGGANGAITYGNGAYGNDGEAVHVGTIPAPAGLAVLALGAIGIRRKRSA